MKTAPLLALVIVGLWAASSAPVQAVVVADQQQLTASTFFPVDYWGQTFTPTLDNITGLDINVGLAGPYNISIRDTSNGSSYPGINLGQTGFVSLGTGVQHVDFGSAISLTPGTNYLIRIDDSTPGISGDYYVKGNAGNGYAGGVAIDPSAGANGGTGHDLYFVTYGNAAPEPSRAILLGLGGVGLVMRRRRK